MDTALLVSAGVAAVPGGGAVTPLERAAYTAHSGRSAHLRRVEAAKAIIRDAMDAHPGIWAVGVSGGKDSTALLSVALEAGWRGPLFHFWYQETPPENTALVHELGERFDLSVDTVQVPGAWDVYDRVGFFTAPETDEQRAAVRQMERDYKKVAEEFAAARYVGIFWGIRASESRPRSYLVSRRGPVYRASDRTTWTALPLGRWTGEDVWARLVSCRLPWLSVYDRADDRNRERSEPVWLACPTAWSKGSQAARMREADPELWERLCRRWPELRAET